MNVAEIRRTVERAKLTGMLNDPNEKRPVTLKGERAVLGKIAIAIMDVDPATATAWLARNTKNRKLKTDTVDAFARDIAGGHWRLTHQGVAFDDQQNLIDGQHRLHAIVKSGVKVQLFVSMGWPSEASEKSRTMDAVDRGVVRSVADQLHLQHGMESAREVTRISASIARICRGGRKNTGKLTTGQALDVIREFGPGIQWMTGLRVTKHGIRSAVVRAVLAMAWCSEQHRAKVEQFTAGFIHGAGLDAGNPILPLRNQVIQSGASVFTHDPVSGAETVAHHLKMFIDGKPLAVVRQEKESLIWLLGQIKPQVEKIRGFSL